MASALPAALSAFIANAQPSENFFSTSRTSSRYSTFGAVIVASSANRSSLATSRAGRVGVGTRNPKS